MWRANVLINRVRGWLKSLPRTQADYRTSHSQDQPFENLPTPWMIAQVEAEEDPRIP
ncbi:hypothetical protein [Leptolyngbya sp. FACHB-261]|uniref:hypothetical protein n=1 Tax=Leptolyngbya sp. FACHB-261 TaxID=2692806 RepID=UPI0016897229|nr:hypothetical protein [Leptolyngbya sp. FACHB-261]MBD2100051.1 hypothetical protein [Leptolyngbya sp. FACHB-261]